MIRYQKINKIIKKVEKESIKKQYYYNENTILIVLKELIKKGNKKEDNGIECINNCLNIRKIPNLYELGINFSSDYIIKLLTGITTLYSNNDNLITTDYHNYFRVENIDKLLERIEYKFIEIIA